MMNEFMSKNDKVEFWIVDMLMADEQILRARSPAALGGNRGAACCSHAPEDLPAQHILEILFNIGDSPKGGE
jgi:hypothetical protein